MAVARSDKEYLGAVWGGFRIEAAPGETDVVALKIAHDRAASAWADIHTTHTRKMGDQTKTPVVRLVESAKFARQVLQSRRDELATTRARAADRLGTLKAGLLRASNPPSDPGEAVLFGEVRHLLRSLPLGERLELLKVSEAAGGDKRFLHAAVSGPAELGLLPPELHAHYLAHYLAWKAPNEYGETVRIEGAIEATEYGMEQLEEHAKALIDFPTAEAAERSAT